MIKGHKIELNFEGKNLSIETGRYAKQADGSVWLKYGNTVLLATVVASKNEITEEPDFFPLTVDYIEKFYASGRFPGGFLKRESQPSSDEKLTARVIDRPIRPLFADWFKNDTHLIITLLSHDETCDPKVIAVMAASTVLSVSDIPFHGPIAACRIIEKDGEFIINPTPEQQQNAKLNIVMAANRDSIVMVEGEAKEAAEEEIVEALEKGHQAIQPLLDIQEELQKKVSPEKRKEVAFTEDPVLKNFIHELAVDDVKEALKIKEKLPRYAFIKERKERIIEKVKEAVQNGTEFVDFDNIDKVIRRTKKIFEAYIKESMRNMIVKENKRIDGRKLTDVRPIWIDLGVLPNVHGSAIFTRGETQGLGTLTLGSTSDEQRVDTVTDEYSMPFMLHYNFPPFSVGETGRLKPPGRREIGHGKLAERALKAILPPKESFPYTIRLVSEILESNGSSSMATVCSGCLALMDAGVPFKKHVAGIAMGLIKDDENYIILSDILGDEDHLGDMDFKVAGTEKGITAVQMDIKIEGLPKEVMQKAMFQAKEGRLHIIDKMKEAIPEHRSEINPLAPRIHTMTINTEKIKDLIGPGGKHIKAIIEDTGADITVEQDGSVIIAAKDGDVLQDTIKRVKMHTDEAERGKVYEGVVTRIEEYGAFVEVMPGQVGLLHISKIADERINNVTDVLELNQKVKVIVTDVDHDGRFKVSMKPSDFDRDFSKKEERGNRDRKKSHHRRDNRDRK